MGQAVSEIFAYLNEILPHSVSSTTVYTFFNMESKKYWKYLTNTTVNSTVTATTVSVYNLPSTNIHFHMLKSVHVGDTTASSDTVYNKYDFVDSTDILSGACYWDAGGNKVGIYPEPTSDEDDFPIVFEYREPPALIYAASDCTTITNFDDDLTEVILNNICARIAKAGKFPRVNLANNYHMDGVVAERDMRMKSEQKRVNKPNISYDWRDWVR